MPTLTSNRTSALLGFLRPRDWWYYVALPLIGGGPGARSPGDAAPGLLAAGACMAFAFGWNSWNDEGVDTFRPWSPRQLAVVLLAATVVALGAAWTAGPVPLLAAAVSLVAGWCYSGGPRLKGVPYVNTLANAPIFVPLGLMGGPDGPLGPARWMLVAAFGLLLLQNQLIHEIQHDLEDRAARVGTTYQRLGANATGAVSAALGLAAAVLLAGLPLPAFPPWLPAVCAAPQAALSVLQLATRRGVTPQDAGSLRSLQRWIGLAVGAAAWVLVTWSA